MSLRSFVQSYLGTALWSSTDDDGDPLDNSYDIDSFTKAAITSAAKDCKDFIEANAEDLARAGSDEQNGHDFWLTRNGHGAGFWDRGYGDVGRRLTDACKAYGSVDIYINRRRLHFS